MSDKKNNVILEEYENEFSYKKSKTNLKERSIRVTTKYAVLTEGNISYF